MPLYVVEDANLSKSHIRKAYYINHKGTVSDDFYPPKYYSIVEEIEEPTLEDFERIHKMEKVCILPNPPINDKERICFQRLQQNMKDQRRKWVQLDLDWEFASDASIRNLCLQSQIDYALKRLGLSSNLGYFACFSASAWLVDSKKMGLRIYILLDRECNYWELKEAFVGLEVDSSLFERERLHITEKPRIGNGVEAKQIEEWYVLKHGDRLELDSLPKTPFKHPLPNSHTEKPNDDEEGLTNSLWEEMSLEGFDYKNIYDHIKFFEKMAYKLKGKRNDFFFESFRQIFLKTGNFDLLLENLHWEELADEKKKKLWRQIRGEKSWKTLKAQTEAIENRYHQTICGLDITTSNFFHPEDDVIEVCEGDISNPENEAAIKDIDGTLKAFGELGGVLMLKSSCGTGKTRLLLEKVFEATMPKTYSIVAYRKSIIDKYIEDLKQLRDSGVRTFDPSHYEAVGLEIELQKEDSEIKEAATTSSGKDIAKRKRAYLPDSKQIISTHHALLHFGDNGTASNPFELIMLDEIEHTLRDMLGDLKVVHPSLLDTFIEKPSKEYAALLDICANAKYVVGCDDAISERFTGRFLEDLRRYKKTKRWLIKNNYEWLALKNVFTLQSMVDVYLKIYELVKNNKIVWIQTNKATTAKGSEEFYRTLRMLCSLEDKEIVSCGKKGDPIFGLENQWAKAAYSDGIRKRSEETISKAIESGVKVFINSPYNNVGWDCREDLIDAVFVINYRKPAIGALDMKQAMLRIRQCEDIYYFCEKGNSYLARGDNDRY